MLSTISMEQQLKAGDDVTYESYDYTLEGSFSNGEFKIWFNGTYVHISKGFKSFERKLNEMVRKYRLERI